MSDAVLVVPCPNVPVRRPAVDLVLLRSFAVPGGGVPAVESLGVPRQGPQDVARLAFIQPPTHAPECQLRREGDAPM